MSIIFLADDFPPELGGIQTYSCELARALAELGEEVAVLARRQDGGETFDAPLPFPVIRVPTKGNYAVGAMNLSIGAQQALQQLQSPPRCMVATKWAPEGPAAILAHGQLRCPIVLIGHGGEFSHTGGSPIKWLVQRTVLRRTTLCLANSSFTADLFAQARVPRERIRIIYGGVRPERYEVAADRVQAVREDLGVGGAPLLFAASRLVERKGHEVVLRALPAVLEAQSETVWLIAGEGPLAEPLQALAAEVGVADAVRFLGRVDDDRLAELHAAADLFVMPSRPVRGMLAEGLGLAYLEAAAAGTPSVATTFGGIPDAVVDGETGLLVPPDDSDALAQAIVSLLGDPERRRAMGEAARERVLSEFTWRHVAERFLSAISTLPGGGAAR